MYSCVGLHKAQDVIDAADSLLLQHKLYADTAIMFDAAKTFNYWKLIYPEDYAKANYYYGRQLRGAEDYESAMQCFLNVIHSRTDNNNILGRTYTNIAIIADIEGSHQLSYTLFQTAAYKFLLENDSTAYLYALNDMALELANTQLKDDALQQLDMATRLTTDNNIINKCLETKAILYKNIQMYDSAIYYAKQAIESGLIEPTPYIIIAQSYSFKNQNDSATHYARLVLNQTNDLFDLNNIYYILINNEDTISTENIRKYASIRADIQKQIELRQSKLTRAVDMFDEDMNKHSKNKSIYIWIFSILSILIICISYILYKWKYYKDKITHIENEQHTHNELLLQIQEKQKYQQKLDEELATLVIDRKLELLQNCKQLNNSPRLKEDLQWNSYKKMCNIVNNRMYNIADKLKKLNLTEKEIRLCVLVMIDVKYKEMAQMLNYSENGIGKFKYLVSKKLNTTSAELRHLLIRLATEQTNADNRQHPTEHA